MGWPLDQAAAGRENQNPGLLRDLILGTARRAVRAAFSHTKENENEDSGLIGFRAQTAQGASARRPYQIRFSGRMIRER